MAILKLLARHLPVVLKRHTTVTSTPDVSRNELPINRAKKPRKNYLDRVSCGTPVVLKLLVVAYLTRGTVGDMVDLKLENS